MADQLSISTSRWTCFFTVLRLAPSAFEKGVKSTILITFDEQLLKRVDDFRFGNRINTRSEAIRRLIDEGLSKYEKKTKE